MSTYGEGLSLPGTIVPSLPTWKRVVDVGGTLALLLVLSPVFIAVIAVLATSSGPIIYRSPRYGVGGRRFDAIKFRSMVPGADEALHPHLRSDPSAAHEYRERAKLRDDPRVTRFGRLLRRYSLDELPQLLNVLRGDMSLVGPRPVLGPELAAYGQDAHRLLSIRPGLTGLWQVSGRSSLPMAERVRLDLHYVEHQRPWLDTRILVRTPLVVALGERNGAW